MLHSNLAVSDHLVQKLLHGLTSVSMSLIRVDRTIDSDLMSQLSVDFTVSLESISKIHYRYVIIVLTNLIASLGLFFPDESI